MFPSSPACLRPPFTAPAIASLPAGEAHELPRVPGPRPLSPRASRYRLARPRVPTLRYQYRKHLNIVFALDTGGLPFPNSGDQNDFKDDNSPGSGRTRLEAIVRATASQLLDKLNTARKNFPTKIFLLLLGFYTANALATILGQTGDWDVLVAGVVVAAIEAIGMLMYRKPQSAPKGRMQSLLMMINYWKAGVCLGLFVDAFKLGS